MSKLISYITLQGKLTTVTSLHMNTDMVEDTPFIPAHLIRSKMRSLLELYYGLREGTGRIHRCENAGCFLCLLFGSSSNVSRLMSRDANLIKAPRMRVSSSDTFFPWEIKAEGDRIIRRIPPGTIFDIEFLYRIFEEKKDKGSVDKENFKYILDALILMENDYLGKGGARGSGKVEFFDLSIMTSCSDFLPALPSGWELGAKTDRGGIKLVRPESL